jgi:CDP-glucose 4,6-dehydratase
VLEPLSGYLMLAQRLYEGDESLDGGWNFGPPVEDAKPVQWIVQRLCDSMPGSSWRIDPGEQPHEAQVLSLDSTKARTQLGWSPTWNVDRAIDRTIAWHRAWRARCDMQAVCIDHIREHEAAA